MSRCSKKCNEIKEMIDSISGLDDDYVYGWLKSLESVTCSIVGFIDTYADRNELNGTCFKDNNIDIDSIEEFELAGCNVKFNDTFIPTESLINDMVLDKINELIRLAKQHDREIKELKKEHCCICGEELTKENKALDNMCWDCKYREE